MTGDVDVAIAHLPDGLDPFDLMRRDDGPQRFTDAIAAAHDALDYQFDRVGEQLRAAETVTGRQRVIEGYLARLGQIGLGKVAAVRRAFVVQKLADLVKMPEPQVADLLRRHERPAQAQPVNLPHDAMADAATAQESPFASENRVENHVATPQIGRHS